jgi:hypothetical protein
MGLRHRRGDGTGLRPRALGGTTLAEHSAATMVLRDRIGHYDDRIGIGSERAGTSDDPRPAAAALSRRFPAGMRAGTDSGGFRCRKQA